MTRKQIYQIIEKDDGSSFWSHIYDVFMVREKECSISTGQHEDYTLTNRNIAYKLNKEVNSFSLRVLYDITCWNDDRIDNIYLLASIINKQLLGNSEMPVASELQEKGIRYTL